MYDIISSRKINKNKVVILIILLILLVVLGTLSGIKLAEYNKIKEQALEYQRQQEQIKQEEIERKKQEEAARQAVINKRIEKYLYTLDIENGYMQELGEHEEEYVPDF